MIIVGKGGHAKVVYDAAKYRTCKQVEIFSKKDIEKLDIDDFIVAIGNNKIRKNIFDLLCKYSFTPRTICHDKCTISNFVDIGKGTYIGPGAIINSGVKIGNNVIINTGTIIEHDCIIEDHTFIAPGVILCGDVKIKEGAFIGAGVVIIPKVSIGRNQFIKAGERVSRNLNDVELK